MLSDCRVGSVGTNKNVAVVGPVVGAFERHAFVVLGEREDSLAQVDVVLIDLAPEQVVEIGPGERVVARSATSFC